MRSEAIVVDSENVSPVGLGQIDGTSPKSWRDSDVPLAQRGVSVSWLIEFVRGLLAAEDQPGGSVPRFHNVRSFVVHVVLPATDAMQAPLWALVPEQHRGPPDYFVSHAWDALLMGPSEQPIGTLDAIQHLGKFAWIDFVSYNQHTIESVPTDMEQVVAEVGKVVFAGTPVPMLRRIWCLWELLCAHGTGTSFDIAIRPGYRNDKIVAVNTFYRSFIGVENAVATSADDLRVITDAVLSQFGSPEVANEHFDHVLRERFSGSWYELHERDELLRLRPWPWLAEQTERGTQLKRAPATPSLTFVHPSLRDGVIYGTHESPIEVLTRAGWRSGGNLMEHALLEASKSGDLASAQSLLTLGADANSVVSHGSPLSFAAGLGHGDVAALLLDSGADIEGGTGLSPLALAARNGHDDLVRLLLERGADIEGDADGPGTALMHAAGRGHTSIVNILLDNGADVDAKAENRFTPLLAAAAAGHADIAALLIAAGADVNCVDRLGDTPLHHAAHHGHSAVIDTLLESGAGRAVLDEFGDDAYALGQRAGLLDPAKLERLRH